MRRRRSPSLSTPTSVPASSITGNPLTWRLTINRIASATLACGDTETIILVITSLTRIRSSSGPALSLERGCHRQAKGVLMRIKPPGMAHGCRLRFSRDEGSLSGGQARREPPATPARERTSALGDHLQNCRSKPLASIDHMKASLGLSSVARMTAATASSKLPVMDRSADWTQTANGSSACDTSRYALEPVLSRKLSSRLSGCPGSPGQTQ